ncbi:ABC transporter permease [Streptomyces tsukubensis]|uniref:ABC transporter permease n=1 Tax=Streptomyces tsukubensis TaxID=83656 RepID=UPI00369323DA
MNLFKRAWWRLTSRPGKTVMLVGLFSVICTLVLSGFLIRSAAARAADDAKAGVGAVATMQLDLDALMEKENTPATGGPIGPGGDLRRSVVDKVCASSVVRHCNYSNESVAAPTTGSKVYQPVPPPPGTDTTPTALFMADGVRDQQSVSDFRNGESKIVSGRAIGPASKSDEVVVERRLARQNGWKVGDRIRLKVGALNWEGQKKNEDEFTFRLVGVYAGETTDTGRYVPAIMHPVNRLFVTPDGATLLSGKKPEANGGLVLRATFTLGDPADMSRLKEDAKAAGADLDVFPLTVNDKQYRQLVGPISRTADFATVTVWIVALAGTVILALIVASSLRERRTELGILLSLGERKPRLLGQHLVEVVSCAVIAVGLASAGGQILSQAIGDRLLAGEVSSARKSAAAGDGGPGGNATTDFGGGAQALVEEAPPAVEPIDSLDVRLGTADIALVGATGLGIATLATLVPGARVLRLHPRSILTKGD